jgi:hypothetical protein
MSLLILHSSSVCHMKMKDAKLLIQKDAALWANLALPAYFTLQKRRMRKRVFYSSPWQLGAFSSHLSSYYWSY